MDHQRAYQALYVLGQTLRQFDSITADLRDNVLHVTQITGGRVEQVMCAPRPDDGGRLWLWDSQRRPIAQAGTPDAALAITRRLR